MTKEDKELLLKDLCVRLPYGFTIHRLSDNANIKISDINDFAHFLEYSEGDDFKPYLRPMSTMTEEEKREVSKLGVCYDGAFHNDIYDAGIFMEEAFTAISWLLERYFDINYLIQKGLALEAPEGMYKTE